MVNTTVVPTCFSCIDFSDMPADLEDFVNGALEPIDPADYANVMIVGHQLIVDNFTDLPFIMDGVINMIICVDSSLNLYQRIITTLSKERCVMMTLISPVLIFSLHFLNLSTLHTHTHTHTYTHTHTHTTHTHKQPLLYLYSTFCLHEDPIPLEFTEVKGSYVEGCNVRILCFNRNDVPFRGGTAWTNPTGDPVGIGGVLQLNSVNRNEAGLYTCTTTVADPRAMVGIPPQFFTLVIHCKL